MDQYKKYIGKIFDMQGFALRRTLLIDDVYLLAGKKKYPAFKCEIISAPNDEGVGNRENFLISQVLNKGTLVDCINVLGR